jgi:biopolymer transport protein TolR
MVRQRKRRAMNQINVVPYIDVTLVLLVIFMVTAPMTNPGVVELPKVGADILKPQSAPVVISLLKSGKIRYEDKEISHDALLYEVQQMVKQDAQRSFVLSADKNVSYQEVVSVLALLKKTGAKTGLLLNPQE